MLILEFSDLVVSMSGKYFQSSIPIILSEFKDCRYPQSANIAYSCHVIPAFVCWRTYGGVMPWKSVKFQVYKLSTNVVDPNGAC